jgi:hypothetical protein
MKTFHDRFSANPTDFPQENFRKSHDHLSQNKSVKIKNKTFYKALKKPTWGIQDKLFFVHRSAEKTRTSSFNKPMNVKTPSPSPSPRLKSRELVIPMNSFKFFKNERAKTPVDSIFKILVKTSELCTVSKPVKPKIIERKSWKIRTIHYRKKKERPEEFSDLNAWNNDSSALLYINNY